MKKIFTRLAFLFAFQFVFVQIYGLLNTALGTTDMAIKYETAHRNIKTYAFPSSV